MKKAPAEPGLFKCCVVRTCQSQLIVCTILASLETFLEALFL